MLCVVLCCDVLRCFVLVSVCSVFVIRCVSGVACVFRVVYFSFVCVVVALRFRLRLRWCCVSVLVGVFVIVIVICGCDL